MVDVSVWNDKEIAIYSPETKEKVSNAIKGYIISNWNQCINIEKYYRWNLQCQIYD